MSITSTTPPVLEVYMQVRNLRLLQRRVEHLGRSTPRLTQRDIAAMAGWKSHGLLTRILSGTVNTVEDTKAVRLAHILGVGVDDLFITKTSTPMRPGVAGRTTRKAAA